MRVLFDTNVVLSGVLKDRDPLRAILFVLENPPFEWIGSRDIVQEYLEVLRRPKFRLDDLIIAEWSSLFERSIVILPVTVSVEFPRDTKDAKFLSCALSANADYFVTGDRDFEGAAKLVGTTILSVRQFLDLVVAQWV
jgi:putative PIN family toxin of toxin-antitoxin system